MIKEEWWHVKLLLYQKESTALVGLRSYLSHQLSVDFGDTIDGSRSLHTEIWCWVAGRGGAEGTDGAGNKQTQAVLGCNVQDVVKS